MNKLSKKRGIAVVIAIALAATLAIPFALANNTDPPTPIIPSQCTTTLPTGWSTSPIINAKATVKNVEDSGVVGYWALDDFVESFVIWQNTGTTPNTFCALNQYSGTWATYAGALSPQNGVSEPSDGSGTINGAVIKIFTGTFLGPYCSSTTTVTTTSGTLTVTKTTTNKTCTGPHSTKPLTGSIGTFNLGGTKAQILLGTYAQQKAFSPGSFLPFYFKSPSITNTPVWSWIYTQGNYVVYSSGLGYGSMWVNDLSGSFGDIVT